MRDAGEPGHAADGHRVRTALLDQADPGLEAGGTQVAVVVGVRRAEGWRRHLVAGWMLGARHRRAPVQRDKIAGWQMLTA